MDNQLKKFVQDELEQITVKISTSPKSTGFKGTGFFITKAGYILTAWHCIQEAVAFDSNIFIESEAGDKFLGRLDKEKSIADLDIAVIKIPDRIDHCVPLGRVPKKSRGDEVISVGYPGIHKNKAGIGVFSGRITRFVDYDVEVEGAIQGQGQSGGLLYHYATHRIVGVVKEIYKEDMLRSAGLAAKVDFLFSKWENLSEINDESAKAWDERLNISRIGGGKKIRITARIATLKQQWELLNKKLSALENQNILETRANEKLRLEHIIAETSAACQKVEEEIDSLESQMRLKD